MSKTACPRCGASWLAWDSEARAYECPNGHYSYPLIPGAVEVSAHRDTRRGGSVNTDAIQPHSDEGEEALLGCLLLDGHFPEGARQWGKVAWLKSRMFTQKRHALIFEAIEGVVAQGLAVDVLTVGREVDKRGTWDEVGGGGYLFLLTNRVPTPLHAVHYASIVKDCWERREKIRRGTRMVQEAVTSTDTMERYAKETPPWKV